MYEAYARGFRAASLSTTRQVDRRSTDAEGFLRRYAHYDCQAPEPFKSPCLHEGSSKLTDAAYMRSPAVRRSSPGALQNGRQDSVKWRSSAVTDCREPQRHLVDAHPSEVSVEKLSPRACVAPARSPGSVSAGKDNGTPAIGKQGSQGASRGQPTDASSRTGGPGLPRQTLQERGPRGAWQGCGRRTRSWQCEPALLAARGWGGPDLQAGIAEPNAAPSCAVTDPAD